MENSWTVPSDHEVLEIVRVLCEGGYESEEKTDERLAYIERRYPDISDIIFWDERDLTPEQILEEAKKKAKPILL